jgi:hypothetical protein
VREVSDDFLAKMIDRFFVADDFTIFIFCARFPYLLWDKHVLFRMLDLMNILHGSMALISPPTE